MTKILKFLEIASPLNDENSRILYRDPPVKLGDDTRTPGDDGYLGILEFHAFGTKIAYIPKIQVKNPKG